MALVRRRPAEAQAGMPQDPCPRPALLAAMRSGATAADRRNAVMALETSPEVAPELAAALPEETDPRVRAAIVSALIAIGTETAAAGLAGLVGSEDAALRNAAVEALGLIGATALPHAMRLLASPDADERILAIGIVEATGGPQARALLCRTLACDPELNVGLAAVEALSQVGRPEDQPALRAFAARFSEDEFVRFSVDFVCRRIAGTLAS